MTGAARNILLYPWLKFFQSFIFYQAVWFLFFQTELSASDAILLYAVYDISTFLLEVPSGYFSDRLGRKITLVTAAACGVIAGILLTIGDSFLAFAAAQAFLGAASAFASGTDSSLLYESLVDEGRETEVEEQEVRAWRFSFAALALSAVMGGALALADFAYAFAGTALSFAAMLIVALMLVEPTQHKSEGSEWERLGTLRRSFTKPVLLWLFAIGVLMYGFSHVPFVFGQPFIQSALDGIGYSEEAPLVSGAVTSVMMLLSVASSWVAPALRRRMGLGALLLLAFGMQIGIAGGLAVASSVAAIPILFLRMVPDAFSQAFLRARIQPELESGTRATWLSIKSLAGRVFFSATLVVAAMFTSARDEMSFEELRLVLGSYAALGLAALVVLAIFMRGIRIERPASA